MKMRCAGLLVCIWCGLWGQETPKDQKPTTGTTSNQPSKPSQTVPQPSAVINPSVAAPQIQPAAANQQQQPQSSPPIWFLRPEWVIVWVTLVYTILTWRTLRTIKRQADLMAEQLADARKDSAGSARTTADTLAAIKRQAESAEKQTEHMESQIAQARAQVALLAQQNQNARDRERAQLTIRHLETPELYPVGSSMNGGRALKVRVIVENLGGSRAFNVRAWGMMNIASERMGDSYDVGFQQVFPSIIDADQQRHFLNVTGLGREFEGVATVSDYQTVTDELGQRIRNGEVFIVVSGMLIYEDIFLDTYETPFHFVWHSFGNDDGKMWLTESYWLDRSERPRRVCAKQEDTSPDPN